MARTKKVHHTPAASYGVLRRVEAHGMRLGRGGKKHWLYVGTGLWTLRTVRRLAERRDEILISETLQPGQRLIIANNRPTIESPVDTPRPPKGRRARKQQKKADHKAAKVEAKLQGKQLKKAARKGKRRGPADVSDLA